MTNRWTMNGFMYLLDVAAYNSFALFSISSPGFVAHFKTRSRRKSLEILATGLINELIESRLQEMSKLNFKHVKNSFFESLNSTSVKNPKIEKQSFLISPESSPILSKKKKADALIPIAL